MRIKTIVWLPQYLEKIQRKHRVEKDEVESVFKNQSRNFFWEKGARPGEDFYLTLGRTDDGRYIAIFYILKSNGAALIISARDMDDGERKRYGKK